MEQKLMKVYEKELKDEAKKQKEVRKMFCFGNFHRVESELSLDLFVWQFGSCCFI